MNHLTIIDHLSANAEAFQVLYKNVTDQQVRWKPGPSRWSLLEVINHLVDEEIEDFRQRLRLVLDDPESPWPPIDPEGWVNQRRYNERDPAASLRNFLKERHDSLRWLYGLNPPDWQVAYNHPQMGPLSAETILANWLAHDLFHIRQVTDLHFAYLTRQVASVSLAYSGWDLSASVADDS